MSSGKVRLSDIAKKVGVSVMTVSYALRGNKRISAQRREEITRVADEMGYVPDPEIARMMSYLRGSRKTSYQATIIVLNNREPRHIEDIDDYSKRFMEGARRTAEKMGYVLEEFWTRQTGMTGPRAQQIFESRNIKGIIIPPCFNSSAGLKIDWSKFLVVANQIHSFWAPFHRVVPHHFQNTKLAFEQLKSIPIDKILFCSSERMETIVDQQFLAAYLWFTHTSRKKKIPPPLVHHYKDYQKALTRMIFKYKPRVVVATEDFIGDIIMNHLQLRVPEDILLVGTALNLYLKEGINELPEIQGEYAVNTFALHAQQGEVGLPKHPTSMMVNGVWQAPSIDAECGKI